MNDGQGTDMKRGGYSADREPDIDTMLLLGNVSRPDIFENSEVRVSPKLAAVLCLSDE